VYVDGSFRCRTVIVGNGVLRILYPLLTFTAFASVPPYMASRSLMNLPWLLHHTCWAPRSSPNTSQPTVSFFWSFTTIIFARYSSWSKKRIGKKQSEKDEYIVVCSKTNQGQMNADYINVSHERAHHQPSQTPPHITSA
jgi:hypothetical protein